jgi:asparagine synthase (glutamine-hydrolysing)
MCGIAGIYGSFQPEKKQQALDVLSRQLVHRGPDGCGDYIDDKVGLVHTRLSIIDLSKNGNQPLFNEDKSIVLICNGEIYNYQEIRTDLLSKGHSFCSNSDSEVILHLYEEHNGDLPKLLARLTGMFAFALWDIRRQKLFIARDRIGIKPMYYSFSDGNLVFASEVKPIAATSLVDARIDHTSLYEYFLLGSIPAPNTLYSSIKCLEPGNFLTVDDGKLTMHEYWDIPEATRTWAGEDDILTATESLLSTIVKDHLIADVPVGTFLSAGVDSSLIAAMAVEHHPRIESFTASFPGEPEDEGTIAEDTARKLQTTHHSYKLTSGFFEDFKSQFHEIDQPFAISSALSLGRISRMAKQHVKAVLSGDGGDELFGGYTRHEFPKQPSFLRFIPTVLRDDALKMGAKLTGKKSLEKLRQTLNISEAAMFVERVKVMDQASVLSLFSPDVVKEIDVERYFNRINTLFEKRKDSDRLNRVLYVDMKSTLVDEMLSKCDRMTMLNGIEGRVPFLDHRLVELAFSIPGSYKRKNDVGKLILRQLLSKRLGPQLAYRAKTGFNSPLKQWLANDPKTVDFVRDELSQVGRLPFVDSKKIEQFRSSSGSFTPQIVFSLVCLNHFFSENTGINR